MIKSLFIFYFAYFLFIYLFVFVFILFVLFCFDLGFVIVTLVNLVVSYNYWNNYWLNNYQTSFVDINAIN